MARSAKTDETFLRAALVLARRAFGQTSPNPMVGAVLVRRGRIIGRGWHHRAGEPHAEVEAFRDAARRQLSPVGATLYVTLEPCCTHGRTPPCTDAILAAGVRRVVVGAVDPNPSHAGRGLHLLEQAGVEVQSGVLNAECGRLTEAFAHWITRRTPLVTVKAAMTMDGKIATAGGESKWITGPQARAVGLRLRQGADAILVGVNTVLADDPSLTVRGQARAKHPPLRRIILDSNARTPLTARLASDDHAALTTVVVTGQASARRVKALERQVAVWVAPKRNGRIDLKWLLRRLGRENVTSLLVEGGGEVNASFLLEGLAQRIAFFYAPKILGGRDARKAVAGDGLASVADALALSEVEWRRVGPDLYLTARVDSRHRFRTIPEPEGDNG